MADHPAIAAAIAFPLAPARPEISIALFMLAVVIAAVAGGLWGRPHRRDPRLDDPALVVEDPQLTFGFDDVEDVATGVVFLSVALIVGLLVGQASEDRARASRRERGAVPGNTLEHAAYPRGTGPSPPRVRRGPPRAVRPVEGRGGGDPRRDGAPRRLQDRRRDVLGAAHDRPAAGGGLDRQARRGAPRGRPTVLARRPAPAGGGCPPGDRGTRSRAAGRSRGSHSSTPRRTSSAPRCSPRSPTTSARRSPRSRRASPACWTPRCTTIPNRSGSC